MQEELIYQVALELLPGVGHRAIKQLTSYCGSAEKVFTTPKSRLLKIPGIGEKMAHIIQVTKPIPEAEEIIKRSIKIGSEILHYTNPNFPQRLRQVPDSPNILFRKGSGDLNPKRCVAIVGTRKATLYGKEITNKIIEGLSSIADVSVISGLAYGIDIQAHKSCLNFNVPTLAVLAGGLDRVYPSTHKKYAEEIQETGGILSESFPGTTPDPHLFPARNRIIAGMADATIIVEAAEKGGALITANIADSYGRQVFAVPGELGKPYSEGTNKLIALQKASIYTGIEDLIYHLNWDLETSIKKDQPPPELTEEETIIYDLLAKGGQEMEIDLISINTQLPINKVASLLLSMEFKGVIKSLPGKKFRLMN